MKNKWKDIIKLVRNIYSSIFMNGFNLIISQGIFLGLGVYFLTPLINYVLRLTLTMSGLSYITLNNIDRFIFYPFSILVIFILFLLLGILFLFEGIYLITYFSLLKRKQQCGIIETSILAIKNMIRLMQLKKFILIPFAWVVTIAFNLPLIFYVVKKIRYFRIALDAVKESPVKSYILLVIVGITLYLAFRNIYSYVLRIVGNSTLQDTKEYLNNIDENEKERTVLYFLGWNIILSLIIYTIYIVTNLIAGLLSMLVKERELVMATFLGINDQMSFYVGIIIFLISMVGNYSLLSNLIFKYGIIDYRMEDHYISSIIELASKKIQVPIVSRKVTYKRLIISVILMLCMLNTIFMYGIFKNGSILNYVGLDATKITSHRGFSKKTPENTIESIEQAIEEGADYVELDVRQTKDGELVLLHDENLKRTTGLNKKIWQVTLDEVKELDAGKWFHKDFSETRIPTLREVFEVTKGRVNLNLDLKYNKNYIGFERKVVELINEYDMELQSNISSTKLSVLDTVKEMNPNIKTGYIIYQVNDSYYDLDKVDFFSINSYFITERLLYNSHKAGKEVHAWTVNSRNEIERLNRIGVDNIITDNPSYAKIILFEAESDLIIVSILKSILRY